METENPETPTIDISKLPISPIATPMSSEKMTGKLLKLVSKCAKYKLIKRGVKEVNKYFKSLRKEKTTKKEVLDCFCILAGDVSPVDVISHIPILCEKNNVPYIYIPSRQMLGTASQTKSPASVVLLIRPPEDLSYREKYDKLKKIVEKYGDTKDEE